MVIGSYTLCEISFCESRFSNSFIWTSCSTLTYRLLWPHYVQLAGSLSGHDTQMMSFCFSIDLKLQSLEQYVLKNSIWNLLLSNIVSDTTFQYLECVPLLSMTSSMWCGILDTSGFQRLMVACIPPNPLW